MRIMALSLKEKIEDTNQGVYLIGTTPPKIGTDKAQLKTIAEKLLGRLHEIEYDGVIIYDIQDESSRTNQARPFAFKQTVDPREYSHLLRDLSAQDVITYKSVAQRGVGEFKDWLSETKNDYDLQNVVLVGSPSSVGDIKLSLPDAYKALAEQSDDFFLGGVTIAERHSSKRNEHERLIEKTAQGCQFFISQAVYDAQATIELITSYARTCKAQGYYTTTYYINVYPVRRRKNLRIYAMVGYLSARGYKMAHA